MEAHIIQLVPPVIYIRKRRIYLAYDALKKIIANLLPTKDSSKTNYKKKLINDLYAKSKKVYH